MGLASGPHRSFNCVWLLGLFLLAVPASAWHNGGDSTQQPPKFGTHDYIAYKGLDRAPRADVAWIKQNLTAYFIGTDPPTAT